MKKFFRCLHPVIHRHHLMALDHLLSIIHQEDHQSRKIKMSHQGNLVHSEETLWTFRKYVKHVKHSGHSGNMFSIKVATSWQPT